MNTASHRTTKGLSLAFVARLLTGVASAAIPPIAVAAPPSPIPQTIQPVGVLSDGARDLISQRLTRMIIEAKSDLTKLRGPQEITVTDPADHSNYRVSIHSVEWEEMPDGTGCFTANVAMAPGQKISHVVPPHPGGGDGVASRCSFWMPNRILDKEHVNETIVWLGAVDQFNPTVTRGGEEKSLFAKRADGLRELMLKELGF